MKNNKKYPFGLKSVGDLGQNRGKEGYKRPGLILLGGDYGARLDSIIILLKKD